jgi:hypothetical protein
VEHYAHFKAQVNGAGIPYDLHQYKNWKDMNRVLAMSEHSQRIKEAYPQSLEIGSLKPEEQELEIERIGFKVMKGWDGELGIGVDAGYEQIRCKVMQLRRMSG